MPDYTGLSGPPGSPGQPGTTGQPGSCGCPGPMSLGSPTGPMRQPIGPPPKAYRLLQPYLPPRPNRPSHGRPPPGARKRRLRHPWSPYRRPGSKPLPPPRAKRQPPGGPRPGPPQGAHSTAKQIVPPTFQRRRLADIDYILLDIYIKRNVHKPRWFPSRVMLLVMVAKIGTLCGEWRLDFVLLYLKTVEGDHLVY